MDDQALIRAYGNTDLPEETAESPLVTFALFAYNQEQYIREAVEGAFSQTYSPLEIILSDDCSSDQTFEIMENMARNYQGPHLVKVRRGERNFGLARHFDDLMRVASGQFLVAAAGDDISAPERTAACMLLSNRIKELGFIEVRCRSFSGDFGHRKSGSKSRKVPSPRHRVFSIQDVLSGNLTGFTGAGRTYRRDSYVRFPPLLEECPEEDTPALFRCLYGGAGAILEQQLVSRRIHDSNLSRHESLAKMNMLVMTSQYHHDLDKALEIDLIDRETHEKLDKSIDKYAFRKQCAIDAHNGFCGRITFSDVLRSGYFSPREKFYLLRKGLLSRVRRYA